MRRVRIAALCGLLVSVPIGAVESETILESSWLDVSSATGDGAPALPPQLIRPLGTTRWDLTQLGTGESRVRTVVRDASGDLVVTDRDRTVRVNRYRSIGRAGGAQDWLAPHIALDRAADTPWQPALIERVAPDGSTQRLSILAERVGSGWVHLPSRPYEVVLQRVRVRRVVHDVGLVPHRLFYRWVSPRHGVVAQTEWTDDGTVAAKLVRASVVERVLRGAIGLRLYVDRQQPTIGFPVLYGFDRGSGATIASLDPAGHTTIQEMYGATSWDFSGNNLTNYPGMIESAGTVAPINLAETCSANECGFTQTGAVLGREDRNWDFAVDLNNDGMFNDDDRRSTLNAIEREDRATDSTLWLRAVVRNQGIAGSFGSGESRLCYVGGGRQEVPLSQFRNQDGIGWYQQVGDAWSSGDNDADPQTPPDSFDCENNTYNHVCPDPCPGTAFCQIYTKDCSGRSGTQFGEVLGEGPVTLPSGHTFNALVGRTVAEFCTYAGSSCFFNVQGVRTAVYLWQTPVFGTIVRVMSELNVSNIDTFTEVDETDIKFGLFPPVSISVGTITDDTVEISWDPGLDTHRIDGYHVYWDTDSGASTPYAFDQVVTAGQSSLVVGGLDPGTQYFFTVSTMSDFTNPDTGATTTYESILFPQATDAVPGPIPGEVSATTTSSSCTPTAEIDGVIGSKAGPGVDLGWSVSLDPCVEDYDVLGATSATSAVGFSTVSSTAGTVVNIPFADPNVYWLVVGSGTGGTGPWGHYGQ